MFPIKGFDYAPWREGLHLCEHDSTAWVHFCLLEFLMLWWIYALSYFMGRSEGEEEWRVSLSIISHLVISMRLGM